MVRHGARLRQHVAEVRGNEYNENIREHTEQKKGKVETRACHMSLSVTLMVRWPAGTFSSCCHRHFVQHVCPSLLPDMVCNTTTSARPSMAGRRDQLPNAKAASHTDGNNADRMLRLRPAPLRSLSVTWRFAPRYDPFNSARGEAYPLYEQCLLVSRF